MTRIELHGEGSPRALWNDADDKMRVLIEARVHELKEAPHEL